MKRFLPIPIAFLLVSCGSLTVEEPKQSEPTTAAVVADIIEENKDDLNYIKNRTADDIELGDAVRHMVVEGKMSNTAIGFRAREIVLSQKTTPEGVKQSNPSNKRTPSDTAKLCLAVLAAILCCSFIQIIVHLFRRRKNGKS